VLIALEAFFAQTLRLHRMSFQAFYILEID